MTTPSKGARILIEVLSSASACFALSLNSDFVPGLVDLQSTAVRRKLRPFQVHFCDRIGVPTIDGDLLLVVEVVDRVEQPRIFDFDLVFGLEFGLFRKSLSARRPSTGRRFVRHGPFPLPARRLQPQHPADRLPGGLF